MLVTFFLVIDDVFSQQVIMTQHYWGVDVGEMSLQFLHLFDDDLQAGCLHMDTGPKGHTCNEYFNILTNWSSMILDKLTIMIF